MRLAKRYIPFLLLTALFFSCDNPMERNINTAWKEIKEYWKLKEAGKAKEEDDPQIKYAPEFFAYYLENPNTKTGRRAVENAFMMWGNLGDSKQVEKAIAKIDVHSDIWSRIIIGISNAYWKDNRRGEFIELLHDLEKKVTDLKGKTAIYSDLGEHYMKQEENHKKATDYFNKIIALAVDSFAVKRAKGNLYELSKLNIGQIAPNFIAKSINGEVIDLSKLRGKIVLLDFWATWCGPCLPEIPYLKEIYEENKNKDFAIISISLDRKIEDLENFVKRENLFWPQVCDKEQFDGEIAKLYNVNGIPCTYIIDQEGKIVFKNLRKEALVSTINQLLETS